LNNLDYLMRHGCRTANNFSELYSRSGALLRDLADAIGGIISIQQGE